MANLTREKYAKMFDGAIEEWNRYDRDSIHHQSFIRENLAYFDELGFGARVFSQKGTLYSNKQFVEGIEPAYITPLGEGETLVSLIIQAPDCAKEEIERCKPLFDRFSRDWHVRKRDFDRMKAQEKERKDFENRNVLRPQDFVLHERGVNEEHSSEYLKKYRHVPL